MTFAGIKTGRYEVPVVETDLFSERSERFATVNLGRGLSNDEADPILRDGYLELRKKVYVEQEGLLKPSVLRRDGLEIDENDEHSMHFIVVKNLELSRRRRGTGKAAIVACLRLIDNINNNELPVQTLFGNKGKLKDISGQQALEVSRFISRMSNDLEQLQVVANLFNTGLADANHRRMQAVYGVIEDDLQAKLHSKYKVPTKSLTELQSLEEYNKTKNMAVQIGTRAMTRRIGRDVLEELRLEPGGRRYWDLVA